MTLLERDTHYHTYADYLTWSRSYGDELINGTAYVREPPAPSWLHQGVVVEPPSTANHNRTVKLSAYERAGVREVWLIDPVDRTLTIYQLEAGSYGRATILELKGRTQLTAVPGVTIDWARVLDTMS
jgi:Uma2 family endonuclease